MSTCPPNQQNDQTTMAETASATTTKHPHNAAAHHRSVYRRLPKILLLGDSLTQLSWEGWGAYVANVYQRRVDVLNRGYAGYNTRFFLRLLPDILRDEQLAPSPMSTCKSTNNEGGGGELGEEQEQKEQESIVVLTVLFFGANDAAIAGLDDHHHVPVEEYQQNLQQIIDIVQSETGCRRFLLVTPPPVHHEQRFAFQIEKYGPDGATGILERTLENTGQYAQACCNIAKQLQFPCLDLYHDMQDDDDWGKYFYDGLHFSKAGHDYVGPAMIHAIHNGFGNDLKVEADERTGQWCNSASTCPSALMLSGGNNKVNGAGGGPYHDYIDAMDPDQSFLEYHQE